MRLKNLSDSDLIANFRDFLCDERERLVFELEYIGELDRRKLIFHYSSLRSCLVQELGFEEWVAERKIRAYRMLRRFPEIRSKLESGQLNLTLLELAQSVAHREKLSESELSKILETISGMTCRAAMREIVTQYPKYQEPYKDKIRPVSEEHSEVRFVAPDVLLEKLDEIRGLLAHSHPELTMAELIDVLATDYRERHHPEEKAKRAHEREQKRSQLLKSPAAPRVPQNEARSASQPMIHELIQKKGYHCSYVDPVTRSACLSKHALQVDHVHAYSLGGRTEVKNLRFLCKSHHGRISFLQFGESSKYFRLKRE